MRIPDSPLGGDGDKFSRLRPTHPDFARLAEIILDFDTNMAAQRTEDDKQHEFERRFAEVNLDLGSASYLALQRAIRLLGVATREQLVQAMVEATQLSSAYIEGMLVGAAFERRYRFRD